MKTILFILAAVAFTAGCAHTPAKVAKEMPQVWENVSINVENVTAPIEQNISLFVFGEPEVTEIPTISHSRVVVV